MFTEDNLASGTQHTLVLEKIANDAGWVSTISGDTSSHLNIDSITYVLLFEIFSHYSLNLLQDCWRDAGY